MRPDHLGVHDTDERSTQTGTQDNLDAHEHHRLRTVSVDDATAVPYGGLRLYTEEHVACEPLDAAQTGRLGGIVRVDVAV